LVGLDKTLLQPANQTFIDVCKKDQGMNASVNRQFEKIEASQQREIYSCCE
jgi:hypothetical protein